MKACRGVVFCADEGQAVVVRASPAAAQGAWGRGCFEARQLEGLCALPRLLCRGKRFAPVLFKKPGDSSSLLCRYSWRSLP